MSGHSKWAGIKHHKAAQDAKRSNSFTKLSNDITIAARRGGGDIGFNPSLRSAVEKAKGANMPKDKIEKAVKRGTGELGGPAVEELLLEAFGAGNVGILVAALSDNRNRTIPDIKNLLNKHGGRFAEGGGVAYQFTQKGVIRLEVSSQAAPQFEELVIEAEAEDYTLEDGFAVVYCPVAEVHTLRAQLEAAGFKVESAELEQVPNSAVEVGDEELEKVAHLVEILEEYDDVTAVYTTIKE